MASTGQVSEDLTDGVSQRSTRDSSKMEFCQVTVFNTKGADVAHEKNVLKISKCGEGWNSNLTQELNGQRGLSRDYNLVFSV